MYSVGETLLQWTACVVITIEVVLHDNHLSIFFQINNIQKTQKHRSNWYLQISLIVNRFILDSNFLPLLLHTSFSALFLHLELLNVLFHRTDDTLGLWVEKLILFCFRIRDNIVIHRTVRVNEVEAREIGAIYVNKQKTTNPYLS